MSIEVVEDTTPERPYKPGRPLTVALIGPTLDVFEIYVVEEGRRTYYDYYVNHIYVTRDVYLDCLNTADKDRWCPECSSMEEHAEHEGENEAS